MDSTMPDDLTIGPPRLYNLTQAALALGLTRATVRVLVEDGTLPHILIRRRRYIRRATLEAFADGG
jgi:excisionase family DNA binding protein